MCGAISGVGSSLDVITTQTVNAPVMIITEFIGNEHLSALQKAYGRAHDALLVVDVIEVWALKCGFRLLIIGNRYRNIERKLVS